MSQVQRFCGQESWFGMKRRWVRRFFISAAVLALSPGLGGEQAPAAPDAGKVSADRYAPQAFLICQLIGDSDHGRAQVTLSETPDPIISGNHEAIVSALESLQGALGRCSHVATRQDGAARMVFQRGYSIAFSWDDPDQKTLGKPTQDAPKSGATENRRFPLLRWHHFFAPQLEGVSPQTALKRLQHEHPGSVFSFRAEEWMASTDIAEDSRESTASAAATPSLQVSESTETVFELGPQDQHLRIASVFKLTVFSELVQRIRSRTLWWADRPAETNGRSIEQTAREMIVHSDNAATDQLVALLGLHSLTPSLMLFRLKYSLPEFYRTIYPAAPAALKRHIEHFANEEERRSQALCRRGQCNTPHIQSSLDWTATPREVCATLRAIDAHADDVANAILSENEPFLEPSRKLPFSFVGFKGGRDVGVLSAAYLLREDSAPSDSRSSTQRVDSDRQSGNTRGISINAPQKRVCVVVIWNDAQEDVAYGKFSYLTNWFFDAYKTSSKPAPSR